MNASSLPGTFTHSGSIEVPHPAAWPRLSVNSCPNPPQPPYQRAPKNISITIRSLEIGIEAHRQLGVIDLQAVLSKGQRRDRNTLAYVPLNIKWLAKGQHWRMIDEIVTAIDTSAEKAAENRTKITALKTRIQEAHRQASQTFPHSKQCEEARLRRDRIEANIHDAATELPTTSDIELSTSTPHELQPQVVAPEPNIDLNAILTHPSVHEMVAQQVEVIHIIGPEPITEQSQNEQPIEQLEHQPTAVEYDNIVLPPLDKQVNTLVSEPAHEPESVVAFAQRPESSSSVERPIRVENASPSKTAAKNGGRRKNVLEGQLSLWADEPELPIATQRSTAQIAAAGYPEPLQLSLVAETDDSEDDTSEATPIPIQTTGRAR